MEHGPAPKWKVEKSRDYKTRLGLIMMPIFAAVYFIFIVIAVTNPQMMANDVGSLNVAIVYGFGIIITAIVMALIYNYYCSRKEKEDEEPEHSKGEAE
ncbi:DUF485 domain-containing protein [Chloroflexota bacterium]